MMLAADLRLDAILLSVKDESSVRRNFSYLSNLGANLFITWVIVFSYKAKRAHPTTLWKL